MLVFSMLRSFGARDISSVHDNYNIACESPEAILRVWTTEIGLRD